MSNDPISIIMVDDHELVRKSWQTLLENHPRFKVIAQCENGQTAIDLAEQFLPDIMLVDINMSPLNGFTVTQKILEKNPSIKIIGLSVNNNSRYACRMLDLGAQGYLTKTSPLEEIIQGILEVYNGGQYVCEEIRNIMQPHERISLI